MGTTPVDQPQRSGHCTGCQRFIGPLRPCPYCDTPHRPRPSMRLLPVLAVLVSTVGLTLSLQLARTTTIPTIPAAAITPHMNFAHIRITGTVSAPPRVARNQRWATIYLDADSRPITLRIGAAPTAHLATWLHQLTEGTPIAATGQLRLSATAPATLFVERSDHLTQCWSRQP
jgi:hypothetical protein